MLGLLHPQRRGQHGLDPRLEHQGGQDLPRRLRLGDQPLQHPRLDGAAGQGRHRERPGQLHARRRLLGGHDQVRRQDAAGGEDGRARRRPSGHRALHLVQGRRGEEGRGAARRRLRHVDRRRGLHLDPVPERQQLGAGQRRLHGGGRGRRGLAPDRAHRRRDGEDARRARADEPDRRRRLALRRSRASSTTRSSTAGTPARSRAGSTPPTPAASTCTSTTRPATWPRST